MLDANHLLEQLRSVGALKDGHFLLASGRHSDRYVEKFDLLRQPSATSDVCRRLADQIRGERVDVVVGPTTGGVILAFEVARQLGVAAAYAERRSDGVSGREFRRGTTFSPDQRVLVVDDILTTGGSVRETLAALAAQPVDIVAVAVLVDRSGGRVTFEVPLVALTTLDVATWDAERCPLCAEGIPLVKPGTTSVPT
ncbi:MAG: orotate phosphoribosyltransferase [Chloroflexota bacterium]|nr:orotate phosphoribosyltransferase [Chloroflexota bacterium]